MFGGEGRGAWPSLSTQNTIGTQLQVFNMLMNDWKGSNRWRGKREREMESPSFLSIVVLRNTRHTLRVCNILITSSTSFERTTPPKKSKNFFLSFSVGEDFLTSQKGKKKNSFSKITESNPHGETFLFFPFQKIKRAKDHRPWTKWWRWDIRFPCSPVPNRIDPKVASPDVWEIWHTFGGRRDCVVRFLCASCVCLLRLFQTGRETTWERGDATRDKKPSPQQRNQLIKVCFFFFFFFFRLIKTGDWRGWNSIGDAQ